MSKPGLAERKMMARFGGDMPEEKVSKPFGETVADIRNSYVQAAADAGPRQPVGICERGKLPPLYGQKRHRGEHLKVESCINWHCENCRRNGCGTDCICKCHSATPPVPQEAAPRLPSGLSKGAGYKTLGAFPVPCATNSSEPATAPDWAMREKLAKTIWDADIAEDIRKYPSTTAINYAQWPKDAARQPYCQSTYRMADALLPVIREAGSERERELTRRLQITLADIDTLLEIADSNVHPKVLDMIKLSRASRLLGGESK